MFDDLRRRFRRFAEQPAPAERPAVPLSAVQLFERDMTASLDAGLLTGDDVIDAVHAYTQTHSEQHLQLVDPLVKARMMGVLSREIDALPEKDTAEDKAYYDSLVKTGQTLAVHTQVPENTVALYHKVVDKMVADVDAMAHRQSRQAGILDGQTPAEGADLKEAITFLNDMIAKRFDVRTGVSTVVVSDPASKNRGMARWNEERAMFEVESNVADIKTVRDLPLLGIILAHEGVHHSLNQANRNIPDPEKVLKHDPDLYTLLRVCDRNFYTSERQAVYRRHPEEILAHRIGMRFGLGLNDALKSGLTRADFEPYANSFPDRRVYGELERVMPLQEKTLNEPVKGSGNKAPGRKGIFGRFIPG
jgi:hypothetical protein